MVQAQEQEGARRLIREALAMALARRGKPARGAAFKLLLREVDPAFDERKYGFSALKEFLEAYPDVVRVTHDGLDIVASPVSEGESTVRQHGDVVADKMSIVRPDVWRAFTLVDPSIARFYDRSVGAAVMLMNEATTDEPERVRVLREQLASTPDRFVVIMPITPNEQLSEMRAFIVELPAEGSDRRTLEDALEEPLWFRAYTAALRLLPLLDSAWKLRWSNFVFAKIKLWIEANALQVPNLVLYRTIPKRSSFASTHQVPADTAKSAHGESGMETPPSQTHSMPVSHDVRARVMRAFERMSTGELLRLAIPIEYLLDDLK